MRIIFDASVFDYELSGIAKSTLCLYEACKEKDPLFLAFGLTYKIDGKPKTSAIQWIDLNKNNNKDIEELIIHNNIEFIHYPNNAMNNVENYGLKEIATINDILPLQIPGYFYQGFGVKKILGLIIGKWRKYKYIINMKKRISQLSVILTISQFSKRSIESVFNPACLVKTIPLGNTFGEHAVNMDKDNYIIYWGGYHSRKGLNYLVDAFCKYRNNENTDLKLLIVGKKYSLTQECDLKIRSAVKEGIIQELGYLNDNELIKYAKKAKGLFYLSSYEGFGLPIIEAMSLGCPVVTTNRTSCGEIAGDAAIFVEPENIGQVYNAIQKIDYNYEVRKKLIEKGLIQAKKYNWDDAASIFLNVLGGK